MRVRAPLEDGASVIVPAWGELPALVESNRQARVAWPGDFVGQNWAELIRDARREALSLAVRYTASYRSTQAIDPATAADRPIVVGGHQPQLFHPGVWFKNFTLDRLARQLCGVALNLVVDSDAVRSPTVPILAGSRDAPVRQSLALDAAAAEMPFEQRQIVDRAGFDSFGRRAQECLRPWVSDPLVVELWPLVVARAEATGNLGLSIAQARHQLEGNWGGESLELPLSEVARIGAFHRFVAFLALHASRVASVYNGAVECYRRKNHLRSNRHPVPNLAVEGDWVELPLWGWRKGDVGRRKLYTRRTGERLLVSDGRHTLLECSIAAVMDNPELLVDTVRQAVDGPWAIRTRALTTTLFARLFLGDLFMHGIGGGKYDEVTDDIIRGVFGYEPPAYAIVSGTLRLPIARSQVTADDIRQQRRQLRELAYHPECFLAGAPSSSQVKSQSLVEKKWRWIEMPQTVANARERCRSIRAINGELLDSLAERRGAFEENLRRIEIAWREQELLGWREYPFVWYPASQLRDFLLEIRLDKP